MLGHEARPNVQVPVLQLLIPSLLMARTSAPLADQGGSDAVLVPQASSALFYTVIVCSKEGKHSWDRIDLYQKTLKAQFAIPKLVSSEPLRLSGKEALAAGMIARELLDEVGGLELHLGMVRPRPWVDGPHVRRTPRWPLPPHVIPTWPQSQY